MNMELVEQVLRGSIPDIFGTEETPDAMERVTSYMRVAVDQEGIDYWKTMSRAELEQDFELYVRECGRGVSWKDRNGQ